MTALNHHNIKPHVAEISNFWARIERFEQQNIRAARIVRLNHTGIRLRPCSSDWLPLARHTEGRAA